VHLEEQQRQQAAELQRRAELEKQQEDDRQLQKQKASLMEQLAEKDQEQEQKREHDTAEEPINEATNRMVAAVELKNMQSIKVAQMTLKAGNEK